MKTLALMIVIVSTGAACSGLMQRMPDLDGASEPICHCRVPVDCREFRQALHPEPMRDGNLDRPDAISAAP